MLALVTYGILFPQRLEYKHVRDVEEVRAGLETVIAYVWTGLCTAVK